MIGVGSKVTGGHRLKAFLAQAKTKGFRETRVGFFSSARYRDGTPVAAVAAWNEYGTENRDGSVHTPSRPFFRKAVRVMRKSIRSHLRLAMLHSKGIVDRRTAAGVGLIGQRVLQQSIRSGNWEANAESTRKRKKSSRPLIDTGLMRRSATYKVLK